MNSGFYCISLAIGQDIPLSRITTNSYISPMKFCYDMSLPRIIFLPKQSKNLDPSYKTDLDLWDCLGRKKNLSDLWDCLGRKKNLSYMKKYGNVPPTTRLY